MKITLSHGNGGIETSELIENIFLPEFGNETLGRLGDAAVLPENIAMTTDSFVVNPLFFKGGDIGRLAVCGTVNDLLMSGAVPKYLTAGFILETGADTDELRRIAQSMKEAAKEAGVIIVAGDTKVTDGSGGIYINTSGVGFVSKSLPSAPQEGDAVIVSGSLGEHHACILSARMSIENGISSDAAPLTEMIGAIHDFNLHAMRDITRGGLATVLCEFASSSGLGIELLEDDIPVADDVRGLCSILGLDVLYMGNEGKCVVFAPENEAETILNRMKSSRYGENSRIVGHVVSGNGVTLVTKLSGKRRLTPLRGEGLPRIC